MATYYSNDFRAGLKIMLDGEPYAVEASEFVKPGKGQAFESINIASGKGYLLAKHQRGKE